MKRILIIEDNVSQCALFQKVIEKAGYEVITAPDGQRGTQLYFQSPFDLVITDIFMPHEDGLSMIFALKNHAPGVKIIAISGGGCWTEFGERFGPDDPLEAAKKFGADRVLKKPFELQQLLEMIEELLQRPEPIHPSAQGRISLSKGISKKRILIIEDKPSQRQLFKTILNNAGYEAVDVSNSEAGLQEQEQSPFDLIITDIFMPNDDGIDTIFTLRNKYSKVKILAISGGGQWTEYGDSSEADEALDIATRFGADRTLKKPISLQQLVTTVDELLNVKGRLT